MGVGASSAYASASAPTLLDAELGGECVYERSLGQSRFVRTIKAAHRSGGLLVVKVYAKVDPSQSLKPLAKRLRAERDVLHDVPNALAYQAALETEKAGYLVRQFVGTSLYDRVSTRPFLAPVEKKWIAYQLLVGLRDAHTRAIVHGDIKSENVLCTAHNWIYLADWAATFKPTLLPLDDPADFALFYDASGRRTCYIAPERFVASPVSGTPNPSNTSRREVTTAMDVFSLGCVIAELCSDGAPPFTLSQMYRYRVQEYAPDLSRIEDEGLRALVTSMLAVDPDARLSADSYLDEHRGTTFPEVFWALHAFVADVNALGPSTAPFAATTTRPAVTAAVAAAVANDAGSAPIVAPTPRTCADERLEHIRSQFELVVSFFGSKPSTSTHPSCSEDTVRVSSVDFADDRSR